MAGATGCSRSRRRFERLPDSTIDETLEARLDALTAQRGDANRAFFVSEAQTLARLCHAMAERFARGGRLIAFGKSGAARSDARHVAVEFVHPVIVGKRALPAIGVTGEGGPLHHQAQLLTSADDIAIAFGPGGGERELAAAVTAARSRGCLTVAFAPVGADWEFYPPTSDPYIAQELVETLYHVLWELVHVFFEHRGLLEGRSERRTHDAGASSFLYPFLDERERDLDPVLDDVRRSVLMKSDEVGALREQTLSEGRAPLLAAADALHASFAAGGKLLALGNGGSATDAMDVVADLRAGAGKPALDLTEDPAILTAIANDIGVDAIFSRQVIAYGAPGDVLLALSTSGNSANVIEALAQARRDGLRTIAMVGYDGGRVAAERLADHVVITRSEHIPRIQEAQASAYHALVALAAFTPGGPRR
jgi:D-sedoheptulose 7-phosphate isomerase